MRADQREVNEETPMIISSDEELEGEDAEVTSAFSGEFLNCYCDSKNLSLIIGTLLF